MIVRWTPTALSDLESLHDYICRDSRAAADGMVENLLGGIEALTRHPEMGRTGRIAGTRELVVRAFVIAYRLRRGTIEILAIIHGSRRWPDKL